MEIFKDYLVDTRKWLYMLDTRSNIQATAFVSLTDKEHSDLHINTKTQGTSFKFTTQPNIGYLESRCSCSSCLSSQCIHPTLSLRTDTDTSLPFVDDLVRLHFRKFKRHVNKSVKILT